MTFDEIKEKLSRFRVGIAGAGGLGSNCAAALVRSGVGSIVVADFDIVEERNLNRQFFFYDQTGMRKVDALRINLQRISQASEIETHNIFLTQENIPVIFAGCDVIVEAFDKAEMKEMIIETVNRQLPGIPLIVGSGLAGWGNNETLTSRKVDDFLYICGDEALETDDNLPPLAPRVTIVANMQANIVLEILLNR
jgi:sulfur carrier protein ThiS adenylyltransferase